MTDELYKELVIRYERGRVLNREVVEPPTVQDDDEALTEKIREIGELRGQNIVGLLVLGFALGTVSMLAMLSILETIHSSLH